MDYECHECGHVQEQPFTLALSLRLTRKYVDSYQYLDKTRILGTVTVQHRTSWCTDAEDPCEPTRGMMCVTVKTDAEEAPEDIEQALWDTFSYHGCTHEHDCCGCWSKSVSSVLKPKWVSDEYVVLTYASRNY